MIGFWGYGYRKLMGWGITSKTAEDVETYNSIFLNNDGKLNNKSK
jgi:hypothetical protein